VTDAQFQKWVFIQEGTKRLNMTSFLTTDQSLLNINMLALLLFYENNNSQFAERE
jgi:hypothetical protein